LSFFYIIFVINNIKEIKKGASLSLEPRASSVIIIAWMAHGGGSFMGSWAIILFFIMEDRPFDRLMILPFHIRFACLLPQQLLNKDPTDVISLPLSCKKA